MDQPEKSNREIAFEHCWNQFKVYDINAVIQKNSLVSWRKWVLALTIFGAVTGTISSQIGGNDNGLLVKIIGGIGALSVALAAYFSKNLLGQKNELSWVSLRIIAEAIKTEIYLFTSKARPYNNGSAEKLLLDKVGEISEKVSGQPLESITEEQVKEDTSKATLTIEEYISERVLGQIKWYRKKSDENLGLLKNINKAILILGAVVVVLGVLITFHSSIGAWVAVISTVSGAIAAFAFSQRYNYIAMSYQATAFQLEKLLVEWEVSPGTPMDDENLVTGCELTFSLEHKSWMAELSKKKEEDKTKDV